MIHPASKERCERLFTSRFGYGPGVVASAPGRLEVLGNHTDYNAGRTLSCAVDLRCYAALSLTDRPDLRLASTMIEGGPKLVPLDNLEADQCSWARYVLGMVDALKRRGHVVPGFDLLVDSAVPRSAGVSSSAAMEMAVLVGLVRLMGLDLPELELARIGQESESLAVGAKTGLLDQLSVLSGERDQLLEIDFRTFRTQGHRLTKGWCFVAVDSGVKHDLTQAYNDRRAACEAAAAALGARALGEVTLEQLNQQRTTLPSETYGYARHVIEEISRVQEAVAEFDPHHLGELMFDSHESSRTNFRNSCTELDELVSFARSDKRCVGARLSGGGFGGITIHLVRIEDAAAYLRDILMHARHADGQDLWGAVCRIGSGAGIESIA